MKLLVTASILLLGMVISANNALGQIIPEYDAAYSKAPFWVEKSPKKLAKFLTKDELSDSAKIKNIYTWITNNIKYDVKKLKKLNRKPIGIKKTLKRKKGICYQYSELFNELCKQANIQSYQISGYSKGLSYQNGISFYESDHTWNAVKINDSWRLIDPTWGAGYVVQNKRIFRKLLFEVFKIPYLQDKYHFKKRPTPYYFDISPEELIVNHLPLDPNWQLLEFPVPLEVFEQSAQTINNYLKLPDSLKRMDYTVGLSEYEFKSLGNQEIIGADKSHEFNPINYRVLSVASYNKGLMRLNTKVENDLELIELNKSTLPIFNQSLKEAQEHKRTINSIIAKDRKMLSRQIGDRVIKPTRKVNRWVGNNLSYSAKTLISYKKKVNKIQSRRKFGVQSSAGKLTRLRTSDKNIKPHLVTKHLRDINEFQLEKERYDDAIKLVRTRLAEIGNQRSVLFKDIMKTEAEIDEWVPYVSNMLIRIYRVPLIDSIIQKVDQPMTFQMKLIKDFKLLNKQRRELLTLINSLEKERVNSLKKINEGLKGLCRDSEREQCHYMRYYNNQFTMRAILTSKYETESIYLKQLIKDVEFLELYASGLNVRIRQTEPQVHLADAYKEFQMEKLESKKTNSLISIDQIITSNREMINNLKASNQEAAERIKTEKITTSKN